MACPAVACLVALRAVLRVLVAMTAQPSRRSTKRFVFWSTCFASFTLHQQLGVW